jgi:hypothetical protein
MTARKPIATEAGLQGRNSAEVRAEFDVSTMFDLVNEGTPTDVARDKDKMIGEAAWEEHGRKTRREESDR